MKKSSAHLAGMPMPPEVIAAIWILAFALTCIFFWTYITRRTTEEMESAWRGHEKEMQPAGRTANSYVDGA